MTTQQIAHIQNSWETVSVDSNLVPTFYNNLFEVAPQVRSYFKDDMSKQSEKLAYTLGFVVANLDRLDEIKESIEDLGRFHQRLHIKPEYYIAVKDVLVRTIGTSLGEKADEEVLKSWDLALSTVAGVMINAPAKRTPRILSLITKLFSSKN